MRGNAPVVRAAQIRPSIGYSLIRIARIHELLGESKEAVKAYKEAEMAMRGQPGDVGAFARVSAGRLAYSELRDEGEAGGDYNAAWNTYITNVVPGSRAAPFKTWMPDEKQKQWHGMTVREAIGDTLEPVSE